MLECKGFGESQMGTSICMHEMPIYQVLRKRKIVTLDYRYSSWMQAWGWLQRASLGLVQVSWFHIEYTCASEFMHIGIGF